MHLPRSGAAVEVLSVDRGSESPVAGQTQRGRAGIARSSGRVWRVRRVVLGGADSGRFSRAPGANIARFEAIGKNRVPGIEAAQPVGERPRLRVMALEEQLGARFRHRRFYQRRVGFRRVAGGELRERRRVELLRLVQFNERV